MLWKVPGNSEPGRDDAGFLANTAGSLAVSRSDRALACLTRLTPGVRWLVRWILKDGLGTGPEGSKEKEMPLSRCAQCGFVCRVLVVSTSQPECPECGATMSFISRGPVDTLLRREPTTFRRSQIRPRQTSHTPAR